MLWFWYDNLYRAGVYFITGVGAASKHLLQGCLLQKQLLDDSTAKK